MNVLRELRSLVSTAQAIESGMVTAVTPAAISVRGKTGLKSFSNLAGTYKVGDTVRYQGDVLLGKATSADALPVFKV